MIDLALIVLGVYALGCLAAAWLGFDLRHDRSEYAYVIFLWPWWLGVIAVWFLIMEVSPWHRWRRK